MQVIRGSIEQAVKETLSKQGVLVSFVVERPGSFEHGDYSTNAALAAAKSLKKNPREVAEAFAEQLRDAHIEGVEKIEIAGAGFINFFLSKDALLKEVEMATKEEWGNNGLNKGKTIMVEYTDPNPFKEFHIGHLMSNAIGESIARLLEYSSAKVLRANYQGDVGPHVARALWGKMQKPELKWGEAYAYGAAEYENNKEAIDAINKKVYEKSDSEINALYDKGREESLAHFEELYKLLGTKFDFYFFETDTAPKGMALVHAHPDSFKESEGATIFEGSHTRVFVTSQGLPTYETKDLGLLEVKKEKATLDESITVTANEQNDYFKVVLEAAGKLPEVKDIAEKTRHISHGLMRFAQGKMSSRTGNVVTGESLLADLQKAANEKMQGRELRDAKKVAEQVAVGAVKYAILKQASNKDIVFDPEKSLSIEGDSGPYVQYAHTRAVSLLRAAQEKGIEGNTSDIPDGLGELPHLLVHFPDALARSAKELEPHYVTTYITELASAFNSWYASERVIGGEHPHWGVLLAQTVEQTLRTGLTVLGLPVPEEM